MYQKKLRHISANEMRWAYDRWCEGYTYHQIAEALDVSYFQIDWALRSKPRIRPILLYVPKREDKDAKYQILKMANAILNSQLKEEEGCLAFNEKERNKYGDEILNVSVAIFNAGFRNIGG